MKNFLLIFFLAFTVHTAFAQTTCSGNEPIPGLTNGMEYTITVGTAGTVDILITVPDNPSGLVGFLGGTGGLFQIAGAGGTFSYLNQPGTSPYTLIMEFNWAGGAGIPQPVSCPAGSAPVVLEVPITFDDPALSYDLAPFGANMSAVVGADPTDPTNSVMCMTKTAGADCWSGVTVGSATDFCLDNPIPFGPGNMTFYMDVYSPVAGASFNLKVENCTNNTISSEVIVQTTVANGWETLVFDFSMGCANPPDLAQTYSKLIVFPQFTCDPDACGNTNPGATAPFTTESYYADNISMTPPPAGPPALPISFDDPFTNYELAPFGNNTSAVLGLDPADATNEVLCVTKLPGADCWSGVTVGGPATDFCLDAPIDFSMGSVIEMDVYSPVAGAPMLLKVEDCSNGGISSEVLVLTTVSNAWETLVFDFAANGCGAPPNPANTYNKISIFPNFTCTPDACGNANPGAGLPESTMPYYFDNIEFIIDPPPPPLPSPDLPLITFDDPGIDYNLNDFGGVVSTFGLNPLDPTDTVVCVTKPMVADCWGGTTVGGPAGCLENPIPFTATDQIITVDVFSPNVGTPFLLKVEDCTSNGAIASEIAVLTTVANEWETLVFDLSMGCPALNLANTYDRVSVFSEFACDPYACGPLPPGANTPANGTVYYFDNIAFGLPYGVDIADPCVCLDNASPIDLDTDTGGDDGTFGELVSITGPGGAALPAGLVFEVTAIAGGAGGTIAVGDLLTFNAATGHYEINFEHTDAIGYTITVDQVAPGMPTPALTISNVCAYPNPTFDPTLAAQYCAAEAIVTLGGTDALGSDAVSFTIDGAPATEINPGTLALGTHLVVMTWDGAAGTNDGSGTVAAPNEPGCIQTVQQTFEVINDAPAITCPADVLLDCTESLPDGVTTEAEFVALGGTVAGDCSVSDVAFTDVVSISGCGTRIERTYTLGTGTAESSCVQILETIDTTEPTITCPPALTLSCFETIPEPATSAAEFIAAGGTISDDCTLDLSDFTVFAQNDDNGGDNCPGNARAMVRTYFVQDACGNTTTCTQTFTYLESSGGGPVITSILPSCYKYCGSLANPMEADITYDVDCSFGATVNITGPTLIGQDNCPGSIYRYTYSVTDDCGRTSAPVFRDFIIGNDGPTIEGPSFNLFLECGDANNTDYIAAHVALVTANASCGEDVTINHFPTNFNNITCNTSTTVTFVATDVCGRTASTTTLINISDNTAPEITSVYEDGICNEAVCGSNLTFFFNFWKDKVLEGLSATDACDTNVTFSTQGPNSPAQNCPDGTTETVVSFVANDNCGNTSSIEYSFFVTADDTPEPPQTSSISGLIHTEEMQAVEDVEVYLSGGASFFQMFVTGNDGLYEFNDVPVGQNYGLTPLHNQFPMNGVSSYDLILIAQHILNVDQLDSPYKMIAADINRSGSITTLDLVELRKMILYINSEFPNNTSWRFVDANFVFPNADNPFASVFPEMLNINGLVEAIENDFVGVKTGDVNGSAIANDLVGAEDRNVVGDLVFTTADQQLQAGETYEVTFNAANFEAINGYQFTLNFDQSALDFTRVEAGDLVGMNENNFGLSLLNEGVITTSWTDRAAHSVAKDAAVFTISFTAKVDVMLSEVLSISSRYTAAEAYNSELNLLNVNLRFDESTAVADGFSLLQNTPNPFIQETLIGFELPADGFATLNVYDISGRLVKHVEGDFTKGYNSILISNEGLQTGVYHYQLVSDAGTASKKMLFSGK